MPTILYWHKSQPFLLDLPAAITVTLTFFHSGADPSERPAECHFLSVTKQSYRNDAVPDIKIYTYRDTRWCRTLCRSCPIGAITFSGDAIH